MDENNKFLSSYKKKTSEQNEKPHEETPAAKEQQTSLTYEEKSGFAKPEKKDAGLIPSAPVKTKKTAPIVVGAVLLLCVIVGLVFFLNRGFEVVELIGWTENDAQTWARGNGIILQMEQQYNDQFEAGRVISQSAAKGTRVKKGEFVKLVVSLGHDLAVTLPIPEFMNMTKEEIEIWAAQNYMTRVRLTTEYSNDIAAGSVIRYEINDNTVVNEVRRDSPIYIIISRGPEEIADAPITVPNFKEKSIAESYLFANENGLLLHVEEQHDDFVPAGAMISQSIKADEKVSEGTEITLVVSKGKVITVPNFSGYSLERAVTVAGQLGIAVTSNERYSGSAAGTLISQSIKAGSVYEAGDIVELVYSIDNKVTLPSFVGQMRDSMESWANDLNSKGASIAIKVTSTQSNSPKGTILYQDKANVVSSVKATINISVSSGKVVFVPDFVAPAGSGYGSAITRDKALAMCEELNIVPIFVEAVKSDRLPGEIWSQSIEAGKEITEGSTITLKFVPANVQVTVPNYVNMAKADILADMRNQKLEIRFVDGSEYMEGYEKKVYEQSLRAGAKVAAGSVITLMIGPDIPGEV